MQIDRRERNYAYFMFGEKDNNENNWLTFQPLQLRAAHVRENKKRKREHWLGSRLDTLHARLNHEHMGRAERAAGGERMKSAEPGKNQFRGAFVQRRQHEAQRPTSNEGEKYIKKDEIECTLLFSFLRAILCNRAAVVDRPLPPTPRPIKNRSICTFPRKEYLRSHEDYFRNNLVSRKSFHSIK